MIGFVVAGVGVAALGVAAYYEVLARERNSDAAAYATVPSDQQIVDAQARTTAQTVAIVTGSAGAPVCCLASGCTWS